MKKYLMTGLAAIAICAAFTSCSKSDELYNPDVIKQGKAEAIVEKYNQAFLKYIGASSAADIPANQTWGFGGYTAGTRGANDNGNIWYKDWERPYNVNLSSAEIEELKGLLTKTPNTVNTQIIPYENYYVEQIYKGVSSDYAYDNNGNKTETTITGSNQMDWLHARNGSSMIHIDNFNNGNNNTQKVDEGNGTTYYGITLMEDMSRDGVTATNQFAFSESWGTANILYYNYYIVQYKGEWYVGFDFEGHKSTDTHNNNEAMQVYRDWAFTDWIVRISPATAKVTDPNDVCIMAEDLSAEEATDFDFNDVIFTVTYKSDTSAEIEIYCAGGTLGLKVAGQEVHSLFAQANPSIQGLGDKDPATGKYKMINTGSMADYNDLVHPKFTLNNLTKSLRGYDIEIWVDKGEKNAQGVYEESWIELTATGGRPAAKLCVGTDFATGHKWCAERQSIKTVYSRFSQWAINNPTLVWWRSAQ